MNKQCEAILLCHNCETVFEAHIWTEITLGEDPKLDNDIFQNRINFFECGGCGNRGFVIYPIKIHHEKSGEKAMVIPLVETLEMDEVEEVNAMGFSVLEITDRTPCGIFYSLEEIKWEICHWEGREDVVFDPPPAEQDIEEGLQKNIINEHEAEILRNTDWEELIAQMNERADENDGACDFGDERDDTIELYLNLKSALNRIRKVVPFPLRT
jgi:hypothetical protein